MTSDQRHPQRPFEGPRIVAAAFIVAVFGWGLGFYGPPVYLEAVRQARDWPIALVSGAVTLHFLAGVGIIANLPTLHRRFGLPRVTFAGACTLAIGVICWSLATSPWQLYAAALLTGTGWPALGAVAVNAIIAPWFVLRRPAALSMAYNGASIGGVIFSPLWATLIGQIGFPGAAVAVGGVMMAAMAYLCSALLTRTPETRGQQSDGGNVSKPALARGASPRPLTRRRHDKAFVTLAAAMALTLFAQIGLIAHLVSLLAPVHGTVLAGVAAGLTTAAAIAGRMIVGAMLKPGNDRRVAAVLSLLLQVAGCAMFLVAGNTHPVLLLAALCLFGFGIGNATSLPPLIAQAEFAEQDTPRVVASIVAISQAAYAFAPAAFGLVREFGADRALFALAAIIQLSAAIVYLAGRRAFQARPS